MKTSVPYADLLCRMISVPALSREEKNRADLLEESLRDMGHAVERIHNNLLLGNTDRIAGKMNILLNSHLDTVAPVEGWHTDPFSAVVEKGRITGLGASDAGASVVSMITAFHEMVPAVKEAFNLMLLISAEEEVSGAKGIEAVLPLLGELDGVIVGEPTEMQPAVAERGLMVLDGEARGKAGHAGRREGDNAIYRAMKDIQAIAEISFPEQSRWLPEASAQVTMISAGTGHNTVPDICRFVVDVRSNDRYGNERIMEMLSGACESSLIPRSTRLKSSLLDSDHMFMSAIEACGLTAFGSSTLSDMALISFPSLKMGPGDSARSHTAGEYILISELDRGVKGYCRFLAALAALVKP